MTMLYILVITLVLINEFRLCPRQSLLISSDEPSLNKYVKSIPLQLFT